MNHYEQAMFNIFSHSFISRNILRDILKKFCNQNNLDPIPGAIEYIKSMISHRKQQSILTDRIYKGILTAAYASSYIAVVQHIKNHDHICGSCCDMVCIDKFICLPEIDSLIYYLSEISKDKTRADIEGDIALSFFMAQFELDGCKSYMISDGLAQNLLDTNIKGVKTDDINLPYNNILLEVPLKLKFLMDIESHGVAVENAYINQHFHEDIDGNYVKYWNIELITNVQSKHGIYLELPNNKLMSNCIKTISDKPFENFVHWLTNVIIYATWSDAELEHVILDKTARKLWQKIEKLPSSSRKRQNLTIKFKNSNPQERIILGKSVISRRDTKYLTDGESSQGKPLEIRSLVQGHWRHYWVGKGRTHRERRWIKPFWRGPEGAPISQSKHMLRSNYEDEVYQ